MDEGDESAAGRDSRELYGGPGMTTRAGDPRCPEEKVHQDRNGGDVGLAGQTGRRQEWLRRYLFLFT